MISYIIQRFLASIPVVAMVGLITFVILHLAPGDPAAIIAGEEATKQEIAEIREALGTDKPLYEQFVIWVGNLLRGDLGTSVFSQRSVVQLMLQRVPATLGLAVMAQLMAILIGIPLGVLAAWKARGVIDRLAMVFAVIAFSVPAFWVGFMFIWLFAVNLGIVPVLGYVPFSTDIGLYLRGLVLPSLSIALVAAALLARMTRSIMIEVLSEDYVRTARAKGLAERLVLLRHALKAASIPIVTVIGLSFALLLTGVVVIEVVFAIPGMGRLVVDALIRRDYPIIQGMLMVFSVLYIFVNLLVDIAYAYLDPRIRYQ